MDLETENRIAAILLKEARELRRQAENEGALAYLRQQPTARYKPNSRFLTATVLGVQQANRAVEVNEMWRIREKQVELETRRRGSRNESSSERNHEDGRESRRRMSFTEVEQSASASQISKKRITRDNHSADDEGLRDDEIDEFLQSRRKRGRGAIGSRVDETGPYLPSSLGSAIPEEERQKARIFLGPERPFSLKPNDDLSDNESLQEKKKRAKTSSSKKHSSKHKSKGKSKDKKKKKREGKRRERHK